MDVTIPHIKGDRFTLYPVKLDDGRPGLVKTGPDNDRLQDEYAFLRYARSTKFMDYFPEPVEFGEWGNAWALTMVRVQGFYTLEEILTEYPDGIDIMDSIWIYRRILTGIGCATSYRSGSSIFPSVMKNWKSSLLIQTDQHGMVMCGWSAEDHQYYDVVKSSEAFFTMTDKTTMHPDIEHFVASVPVSPDNPWSILRDFDRLLKKIGAPFYPKTFHVFKMPRSP